MADDVIAECGRLPLALSVVGPLLRGASAAEWNDTLALLRSADIAAIEAQLPPGQQSFFRAIEVSVRALEPEMQERYKALAVLLEDMPSPLPILQTLWNVNEGEARRTAKHLADRSLAQREDGDSGIRLHDLQFDYIRAQHPDRDALDLIHGAVRLSSHVVGKDPRQFASQLIGRLLPHETRPAVRDFTALLHRSAPRPWLRPLRAVLHPPGTALLRTLEDYNAA